jgi:hypothetical protein
VVKVKEGEKKSVRIVRSTKKTKDKRIILTDNVPNRLPPTKAMRRIVCGAKPSSETVSLSLSAAQANNRKPTPKPVQNTQSLRKRWPKRSIVPPTRNANTATM